MVGWKFGPQHGIKGTLSVRLLGKPVSEGQSHILGDDVTDEDAFAALQGYGLSVLVRSDYRPTVADVWIRPPEGVIEFLSDWIQSLRR